MPTENELKFVLSRMNESETKTFLEGHTAKISQAYVSRDGMTTVRLRAIHDKFEHEHRRIMTVKCRTNGRVVEIESEIDQRDFDDMWLISRIRLNKIRAYVESWEVDFFLDAEKNVYFILAEIEMPEGQVKPDSMPILIKRHLLHEVPPHDDRFSSRKLADIPKATKLWQLLHREKDEQ